MKRHALSVIKLCIACYLIWFLVHQSKLDFSLLPSLIASPYLLIATVALYFLTVAVSSKRWQKLNQAQGIRLSYFRTLLPTYLGVAFNNLLPGGVGGDFFRFYFLNKKVESSKSAIMLSIFADRVTGLLGIIIIVAVFSLFHISEAQTNPLIWYSGLCCFAMLAAFLVLYFCSFPKALHIDQLLQKYLQQSRFYPALNSMVQAIQLFRQHKLIIVESLLISTFIQIVIATTCMLIAKMMHFPELPFFHYLIAIGITQLVNLIPITPGGFGVGEMAFAHALIYMNPAMPATYATIFLAYRILGIITYLPGLAVFLLDPNILREQTGEA